MSVIAIRAFDHHVDIAVDSVVCYGQTTFERGRSISDAKLWTVDDAAFAFVGTSNVASVLRRFSRANQLQDASEDAVMDYIEAFHKMRRDRFPDGDYDDIAWVVGKAGKAWVVDGYSASMITPGGYFANGSGGDFALGVLHHGGTVEDAVRAACAHHDSCVLPVRQATVTVSGITANTAEVIAPKAAPPVVLMEAA